MKDRGYVRNLFGRYRHLEGKHSYKALNSLIQGGAADLLKAAIDKVYYKVCAPMKDVYPLLYVHDEIIFQLPPNKLDEFLHKAIPVMQDFPNIKVPIRVDVELYKHNWYEGEHLALEWN